MPFFKVCALTVDGGMRLFCMMISSKKSALDDVKAEIATLKKIAHPNCVHMFDVIADPTLVSLYVNESPPQTLKKLPPPLPLRPRAPRPVRPLR